MNQVSALNKAIEHCGSATKLAQKIGVTLMSVSHWRAGRNAISAERAKQIELATNGAVTRHELRPDIFDPPAVTVTAEEGAA